MEKISLYIAGKKVDLDEQSFILYNYATRDLSNPTIVKNSFSKQITLQGTPVNNEIFGNFFRSDRLTKIDKKFTGVNFNPLQKMPFAIYDEKSNLIESGYVKLNSVTREKNRIFYAITLYGELGLFLYNLSYGEDGVKNTLASLDYGVSRFAFPVTKDSIVAAWANLQQSSRDMQSLWDFVNFIPCYNGIPENFSANKAYLPNSDTLVELSRNYTEWETRDLRSKYQNCGMSIKGIFHGIRNWANSNGYQLNLDPSFFNESNPHYERLWYLLSQITYGREVDTLLAKGEVTTGSSLCIEEVNNAHPLSFNIGDLQTDKDGIIDLSSYNAEAFLEADFVIGLEPTQTGYLSHYDDRVGEWDGALIGTKVRVYIDGNERVASSKVYIWGKTDEDYFDPRLATLMAAFGYEEGYEFVGNTTIALASVNIKAYVRGSSQVRISIETIAETNDFNTYNTIFPLYPNEESNGTPLPLWEGELNMTSYMGKVTLTLPADVETGSVVSKETILANTPTPADFLLSYCKQYGLQIQIQNNQINILTRNNFYNGEIIDASSMVDASSIQFSPMPFEKRRCILSLGQYENSYEKKYQQIWGKPYGEMVVDTGYQFNNEEEKLFSSSVFKSGITIRESGLAYSNYKDSTGQIINPALIMGYTKEGEFVKPQYTGVEIVNDGIDAISKLCSYAYDGETKKNLKTSGILVFFNGMKDTQIDYYVSDQEKEENAWILPYNRESPNVVTKISTLPEFSRYWSEDGVVRYSLDFGTPSEIYDATIELTSESSLYERFWKNILRDQYDVDERVMKCKVNFSGMKVGLDLMRNFFYYDNAIWVLDKISNHSITTEDLTECEFVKVKDIKNYSEGQKL